MLMNISRSKSVLHSKCTIRQMMLRNRQTGQKMRRRTECTQQPSDSGERRVPSTFKNQEPVTKGRKTEAEKMLALQAGGWTNHLTL